MKFLSKLAAVVLPFLGHAKERSRVTIMHDMLPKLAAIESNGNPNAVGDGGKSIGMYQISKQAWADACSYKRLKEDEGSEILDWFGIGKDWKKDCFDEERSRFVAMLYLMLTSEKLERDGYKVNEKNLYMAYNMGYSSAKRFNFEMNHPLLPDKRKAIFYRANAILNSDLPFPSPRK